MSAAITGKYHSVTSFKRDGTGVTTPVWFAAENGRLLVETEGDSWKADGRVERLTAGKYRIDRVLILPAYRAVQRLRVKSLPQDRSKPVVLSITPE